MHAVEMAKILPVYFNLDLRDGATRLKSSHQHESSWPMQQFKTATFVLNVIEIVGWIGAGLALAAFALVLTGQQPTVFLLFGAALAISGLAIVAIAQIGHAQVYTAKNSDLILKALLNASPPAAPKRY